MSFPSVNYNGSNYYIVACTFCKGTAWEIAFNPKKKKFIGKCKTCDHLIEITPDNLKRKPIVRTFLGGYSETREPRRRRIKR